MFESKPTKAELLENQRELAERLNDLQLQFNALTQHLKLNVYKPFSRYQVTDAPKLAVGGLTASSGIQSPNA